VHAVLGSLRRRSVHGLDVTIEQLWYSGKKPFFTAETQRHSDKPFTFNMLFSVSQCLGGELLVFIASPTLDRPAHVGRTDAPSLMNSGVVTLPRSDITYAL
jgi:hypothetical protein